MVRVRVSNEAEYVLGLRILYFDCLFSFLYWDRTLCLCVQPLSLSLFLFLENDKRHRAFPLFLDVSTIHARTHISYIHHTYYIDYLYVQHSYSHEYFICLHFVIIAADVRMSSKMPMTLAGVPFLFVYFNPGPSFADNFGMKLNLEASYCCQLI